MILAAVWIASSLLSLPKLLSLALFAVPYLICGYDVLRKAVLNIAHGQLFDENFLMAIATLGAFIVAEYPEAVSVMLFYQVGELFQSVAVGKSRRAVAALMDIRPDTARVIRDSAETEISPDEVLPDEILIVRPGDRIPLDGTVTDGASSVNTAALTGESIPRDVSVGDSVVSGCVNLSGVIRVRPTSTFAESTVSRILELVENSSEKKAKAENFITKFARYYTPIVVFAALALAVIPPVFIDITSGTVWAEHIERALIFLVVSCPCALVVSVPLSFFGAIGAASRKGILIKGANYIEALANVRTVVFDKTGTLTKGEFEVTAVHPGAHDIDESDPAADELLDLAACAESMSNHPIAVSVTSHAKSPVDPSRIGDVTETAGYGVEATVDGRRVAVGSTKLMDKVGAKWHECDHPGSIVHVAADGEYLGHIVISDRIKDESAEAIEILQKVYGAKCVMLSGDSEKNAAAVAAELGIDEYRASLLPENKVEAIEEILTSAPQGTTTAFVGDGINDAPVLSRADVGIAMGALGSDAAIEAADIVLMNDRPTDVPRAISTARRTMRIVRENIVFAIAVKVLILILGALGCANMWLAVFADVGVMVIATINAARPLMTVRE